MSSFRTLDSPRQLITLELEETFFVRRGALRFLLGEADQFRCWRLRAGGARSTARIRECLWEEVDLLVSFHPGEFEELFVTHRSDQVPS